MKTDKKEIDPIMEFEVQVSRSDGGRIGTEIYQFGTLDGSEFDAAFIREEDGLIWEVEVRMSSLKKIGRSRWKFKDQHDETVTVQLLGLTNLKPSQPKVK